MYFFYGLGGRKSYHNEAHRKVVLRFSLLSFFLSVRKDEEGRRVGRELGYPRTGAEHDSACTYGLCFMVVRLNSW